MIKVNGNVITADTKTQKIVFVDGRITEIVSKVDGQRYLWDNTASEREAPLRFVYPFNRTYSLGKNSEVRIETDQYSDTLVNISFFGWHGHGELLIEEDLSTGDVCVTPSAQTSMTGLKACRWEMFGIDPDVEVTVPYMQGIKVPISDSRFKTEKLQDLRYPFRWESAFVAFSRETGGFWVRADCLNKKYKSLRIGNDVAFNCALFDSENTGPIEAEMSAGGVTWKLNVYEGDWTVPIYLYRDMIRETSQYAKAKANLPQWFDDVKLACSWCPTDPNVLDIMKKYIDPKKVIIHLPQWRTMKYDQQYPNYFASDEAKEFIQKGNEMGYHIAPHCNAFEIDPSLPEYELVRDFKFRDLETRQVWGWGWNKGWVGVPEDNMAIRSNRKYNVMAKIHPALPSWQSLLTTNVKKAVDENSLHAVFLDVTHNVYNIHNGTVNGSNLMEGALEIIERVRKINGGIAVGGEGMNETLIGQCFAQGHSVYFGEKENESLPSAYYKPINQMLYGDICHVMSYNSGGDEKEDCDENRGFTPTFNGDHVYELDKAGSVSKRILERALS